MADLSQTRLEKDLQRLQYRAPGVNPLSSAVTPSAIRDKTAVAENTPDPTGGGISSPLTESDIGNRTYHAGAYITTTDGLFAWPAIATMSFTDDSGRAVEIIFAAPA